MAKKIASYGAWTSKISAQMVAGQSIRFGSLICSDGWVYWSEMRPDEAGRSTIMRRRGTGEGDAPEMLLPAPFSARSRVHEYGGGEFLATRDEIYFVHADDQDIYRLIPDEEPERITSAPVPRRRMIVDRPASSGHIVG